MHVGKVCDKKFLNCRSDAIYSRRDEIELPFGTGISPQKIELNTTTTS